MLFFGTERLEAAVTERIAAAPSGARALDAVATALAWVAKLSDDDPAYAAHVRQRNAVIQAHAELRERELSKHARLAVVMATALRSRGVPEPAAKLAAEVGLTAFQVGFERWISQRGRRKMGAHVREAMHALGAVVGGSVVVE